MSVKCKACGATAPGDGDTCEFCGSPIVQALGGMGLLRAGKPQLDKVFTECKEKLKKDPDDPDAHFGLASYYVKRKLHKQAQEHLKKAAELAPGAGEVYYLMGYNLALWRGWGNAMIRSHADKALRLNPKLKEAKSLKLIQSGAARSRNARGTADLSAALAELRKAKDLKVKDHLGHVYVLSGETFEFARRPGDALSMYKAALSFGHKTCRVYTRMGLINKRAGRPKRALQWLEKAHEADPSNQAVANEIKGLKAAR